MYKKIPLKDLIEMIDDGIVLLDKNYDIVLFNKKAKSLNGLNYNEIKSKKFHNIFPELNNSNSLMLRVLHGSPSIADYYQNISNECGSKSSLLISCYPIYENDEIVASMEIYKDITEMELLSNKLCSLHINNRKLFDNIPDVLKNGTVYKCESIIGNSAAIKKAKKTIISIGDLDSSVLIYGETGVGKELFVQAIHNIGDRYKYPFISQNCAALPENLMESIMFGSVKGSYTGAEDKLGLFELADNGVLFLDEINSMPMTLQVKLLRVIQDKKIRRIGDTKFRDVNVRVIASMNEKPSDAIKNGRLREDLYYRLNSTEIEIPPLRDRKEDIELFVNYYINVFNIVLNKNIEGISKNALKILVDYDWPGNVRELKHTIESIMNLKEGSEINTDDIKYKIKDMEKHRSAADNSSEEQKENNENRNSMQYKLREYETEIICSALKMSGGNKTKAAKLLKIPKQTLNNKLIRLKIK